VQPDREFHRDLVGPRRRTDYQRSVVTVDPPVLGPRYRELRAKFNLPPGNGAGEFRGRSRRERRQRATEATVFSARSIRRLTWRTSTGCARSRSAGSSSRASNPATPRARRLGAAAYRFDHGPRNLDNGPDRSRRCPACGEKPGKKSPSSSTAAIRAWHGIFKALAWAPTRAIGRHLCLRMPSTARMESSAPSTSCGANSRARWPSAAVKPPRPSTPRDLAMSGVTAA